jgi:hypothetical protein
VSVFLQPIYTQTVGSGGASSITFNNIPQGFTDLKIVLSGRTTGYASIQDYAKFTLNSNTTNIYSMTYLYGTGSATASSNNGGSAYPGGSVWAGFSSDNATTNTFANSEVYIPNYTSANYKSIICDMASETNATAAQSFLRSGLWLSTSAITSISIAPYYGTSFVQYSTVSLYGVLRQGI